MQVRLMTALCLAFCLLTIVAAGSGGVLFAQTGQTSSDGQPVATAQTAPSPSQDTRTDLGATMPQPRGMLEITPLVLKIIGGLGLVVSLILISYVMFRKFAPQFIAKRPGDRSLRLIETLHMGEKRSLVLVQADGKNLLLASTPGQISLLTELSTHPVAPSSTVEKRPESETPAPPETFKKLFELEKKATPIRPVARVSLPPDIRGKMQELRKALER